MTIKHIVCCTDFSKNAEAAFQTALEMAEKYQSRLTVLHVVPPMVSPLIGKSEYIVPEKASQSLIQQLAEQMHQDYGDKMEDRVEYDLEVRDGHVSTEIIKYLKDNNADVVVVGAYGLSGVGLVIFGSIAKRVAHRAPCSVMIVR